jgi:hypothetical protein
MFKEARAKINIQVIFNFIVKNPIYCEKERTIPRRVQRGSSVSAFFTGSRSRLIPEQQGGELTQATTP